MGNVTSNMSKISMSIINEYKDMFMISAASASNEFSGIDDQFFRVHVANNAQRFDAFTKYIRNNKIKNRIITKHHKIIKQHVKTNGNI